MTQLTLPAGRLVQGGFYTPNTTNSEGQPLVYKNGPNKGQPRKEYFFAVAIPKAGEQHWNQTAWGAAIHQQALADWPQGQSQRPDFAWKIVDGDSQVPDKGGNAPASKQGFPGHWVIRCSSGFPVPIFNRDGTQQIVEEGYVSAGDYIQVAVTVNGNGSHQTAGMYINPVAVAFVGFGERIVSEAGVDGKSLGFGQGPVPQGVMSQPPAGSFNPAPVAAPMQPPAPAQGLPAPAQGLPAPAPEVLQPPAAAMAPPPAAPAKVMTDKAGGASYDQFIASGWTDEQLVQHGYLQG